MFPLPIVLAGCDDRVMPHVRRELLNHGADVEFCLREIKDVFQHAEQLRSAARLFLVHLQSPRHLHDLQRLSSTFIGRPILALVDEGTDAQTVIAAMRAGAAQVVILPLKPPDFRSALECIGLHFGRAPAESQLIAVSGVTGGCGATTLAINLAYELAQSAGQQVILAELSLQMGMLVTYLDFQPQFTLADLLGYNSELDARMVEQALVKLGDHMQIMAGPQRPVAMSDTVLARIRVILNYLRHLARIVVIDIPCTFDDAYFELMAGTDHALLVCEQRIPAIRNVQLVMRSLGAQEGGSRYRVLLNRYDPDMEGFTTEDLEKLLQVPRVLTVTSEPGPVNAALNQGRPLRLACPKSRVLADVETLTRTLIHRDDGPAVAAGGSNLFGRLFNAIGLK